MMLHSVLVATGLYQRRDTSENGHVTIFHMSVGAEMLAFTGHISAISIAPKAIFTSRPAISCV
jgi:hypothetical protein